MTSDRATTIASSSPYILGRSAAEHERLALQAARLTPGTAALLDRVGVAAGASCLDVGCGTGAVMDLLAQRTGRAGRIVGIDLDRELGRHTEARLHAAGHRQCRIVGGDVMSASFAGHERFDLVFGRLVLIHADDPVALLRRMWELTAPGGVLVVEDYVLHAIASEPPTWLFEEFRRVVGGVFEEHRRPLDAGLRLPRWFSEAGIGAPQGTTVTGAVETVGEIRWQLEGVYRSTLPLALESGLTTPSDSEAWLAELSVTDPDHTAFGPIMIGAYARRTR
ncbi:MAG TPA: methyltransferase domain-containing protein [Solirubrobacteraceae bacterium]